MQGSSPEQHGLAAEDGEVCDLHANKSWPIEDENDLSWTSERLEPACDSAKSDEPLDEPGEEAPIKAKKRPATPSRQEIEDHEIDHYPYRSWCRACVFASGRRDRHASDGEDRADADIATVAFDYGFFTAPEDEDVLWKSNTPLFSWVKTR